jgi:hypothetical protein
MDAHPTPTPDDPALLLPRAVYYQVVHTLRGALPLPVTDDPKDAARRDFAAIAHVASLLPANPDEAHLAALYVGASAQAMDCLRLARQHEGNLPRILQCTAQSARMMREAKGWRLALLRAQAVREKRDADATAGAAATQAERRVLGLMADALLEAEPRPQPDAPPPRDAVAEAERYALLHRKNAALIRRLGRLPDKLDIGWVPPDVVHTIATGTTPGLCALDRKSRQPATLAV